jgi:hypothetical protein
MYVLVFVDLHLLSIPFSVCRGEVGYKEMKARPVRAGAEDAWRSHAEITNRMRIDERRTRRVFKHVPPMDRWSYPGSHQAIRLIQQYNNNAWNTIIFTAFNDVFLHPLSPFLLHESIINLATFFPISAFVSMVEMNESIPPVYHSPFSNCASSNVTLGYSYG